MAEDLMRNIQWFPGHMTKTRRMIAANLSLVDAVVEILDARIPQSSRNPEMDGMVGAKPRLLLLNKADMADPAATSRWISAYRKQGFVALGVDCRSGKGISGFAPAVREQLLPELLERRAAHGMTGAPIRLMVVGIPNVGKSSFINRMAQSKRAKVEDRPGVTRTKQWVKIGNNMELLAFSGRNSMTRAWHRNWRLPVLSMMMSWIWRRWQSCYSRNWRRPIPRHWKSATA